MWVYDCGGMLPRLFISLPLYICVCALSCIHAFLRRSWFESPLVCCHTPIRQYVSTYVRQCISTYVCQCISTYVCQYASGAVCLSVRADLPFQMSVSVHVQLFALLLHRFCPQRNIQIRRSVSFPPCVAAFGFVPVACGVFQPLPGVFLPRTFAPKRQGNAPDAHIVPPAPSFFWAAEGYRATDTFMGCYNRFIPNPSCTDSCVLKDTARCPLSNSKGFRLLPETTLPLVGEGFPSEVGKPVSYLRYACRKLRLCRETNH